MGSICNRVTGERLLLEPEHLIGRLASCGLRLNEKYISAQHALLRWIGSGWRLKDLGSRNGTFLDGARVTPGNDYDVRCGSTIAFGKVVEQVWVVVDDGAPENMVVPLDGGGPVLIEGELLALPSSDDPQVTLYRRLDGSWVLERNDQANPITSMQVFELGGRPFRFCAIDSFAATSIATTAFEVRQLELVFHVSQDEEFVKLEMIAGGDKVDLGCRGHNYLLLTLARARLADQKLGHPDPACGWVCWQDLAHDPSMAPPQLNIDVFRIRKHFARMGVSDAAEIIERRPRTGQMRLGVSQIKIHRT
jgi:pSer/pThr/pTyr-binding forkhead associated (FHA) protein